ncbi:MAG: hypothetical protein ACOX8F_04470 [Sakamotonia sp.]|jgi:hypothetical protein
MGKKGYALVETAAAIALVILASGALVLGIAFGLRMETRAKRLKDMETVQESPACFRMKDRDGGSVCGKGYVLRQEVGDQSGAFFIHGFGMEPGTDGPERQLLDHGRPDQKETE